MITKLMSDPAIFGDQFSNDSWESWRALLSGFYGERCTDPSIFETLTQRTPEGPYSELWIGNWQTWRQKPRCGTYCGL